jgi:hypothetical protein
MPDELKLPDELAACEARLAALAPPASRIDRDELLYRAGWAAGVETTRLATLNPPPSQGGARGGIFFSRSALAASAASAALAASLAVAITLQWRPAAEPAPLVGQERTAEVQTAAVAAPTERRAAPTGRAPSADVDALLARLAGRNGLRAVSPLAARQRLGLGDEGTSPAVHADASTSPAAAKTARQLLEELLPESRARDVSLTPTPLWPWSGLHTGESI